MRRLSASEVQALDPYVFLAVLGKRVIHPGSRHSTDQLLEWAGIQAGERVLDIGCGVGTTAVRIAREAGAEVVAADISPLMRECAEHAVRSARLPSVTIADADILALPYPDASFDGVIAEAVTMFVDRCRAAAELSRVCKPGGRVLATEFCWRREPTDEARKVFLGQVCPGLRFDSVEDWVALYGTAGLGEIQTDTGPFAMMTARGFIRDEGWHAAAVCARVLSRPAYVRKMEWLMPRMGRAVSYLGYVVVSARKPRVPAETIAA
jgi:SAM-dependent methyltransferase